MKAKVVLPFLKIYFAKKKISRYSNRSKESEKKLKIYSWGKKDMRSKPFIILLLGICFLGNSLAPIHAATVKTKKVSVDELNLQNQKLESLISRFEQQEKELQTLKDEISSLQQEKLNSEKIRDEIRVEVDEKIEAADTERFSLEDRLGKLEKQSGIIKAGGWADFLYSDNTKPANKSIMDFHHLYMFFDARIDENWKTFSELEYEHAPVVSVGAGNIKLERGYIEHNRSASTNYRFGKFNSPLGIWTPEHWAINVDSVQKPIHEDNKYIQPKQVGVQYFGKTLHRYKKDQNGMVLNYTAYLSNGPEESGTNKPADNKFGAGADVNAYFNNRLKLGASYNRQNNAPKNGRIERSYMLYGDYDLSQKLKITSEYFFQDRSDPGLNRDVGVIYGSLKWQATNKSYLYYRWNRGEDEKSGMGARQTLNTITYGYWFSPYVRAKFEYNIHKFDDPTVLDFGHWNVWLGTLF